MTTYRLVPILRYTFWRERLVVELLEAAVMPKKKAVVIPGDEQPEYTSFKVDRELIRKAKAIVAIRGGTVLQLIDALIRSPIESEYTNLVPKTPKKPKGD